MIFHYMYLFISIVHRLANAHSAVCTPTRNGCGASLVYVHILTRIARAGFAIRAHTQSTNKINNLWIFGNLLCAHVNEGYSETERKREGESDERKGERARERWGWYDQVG